jgi:hypothetical protein
LRAFDEQEIVDADQEPAEAIREGQIAELDRHLLLHARQPLNGEACLACDLLEDLG